MLQAAFTAAANALNDNKDLLDAMNVFPVPDGDTGINMYLTALSAATEAEKVAGNSVGAVAKAASAGALRGARGNSGVILSQLFRGFAKALDGLAEAGPHDLARAFAGASETAYRAIMKPKEGTILTVARAIGEKAAQLTEQDTGPEIGIDELFVKIIQHGNVVLGKTKEMLPALKAADVEDAGGKGFLVILNGMYGAITGEHVPVPVSPGIYKDEGSAFRNAVLGHTHISAAQAEDIVFGYCTELFITAGENAEQYENELMEFFDTIGDSIVVVSDDNLVKIHVHTNDPGIVLQKALTFGYIDNISIENMRVQQAESAAKGASAEPAPEPVPDVPLKDTGFIAVANGQGFIEFFTSMGADYVIQGGQSMNPSADEFIKALRAVPAKSVIILPNNKNIILAARQAASMCTDKEVFVIPSRSMPQGLAALTGFVHSVNAAENAALMEEMIKNIHSGLLTHAVRDTVIENMSISKGDAICIIDGKIALTHKNTAEAARRMAAALITEDISFVACYYGEGVRQKDAEKLMAYIKKEHPDLECELQNGGQPVYKYIISAE